MGRKKRFCSDKCRQYYNSKIQYQRIKTNPIYKAKQKIAWNKWLKNHRDKFNDYMRPINRIAQAKRRKKWKELDLCSKCGGLRKNNKYITCEKCRR